MKTLQTATRLSAHQIAWRVSTTARDFPVTDSSKDLPQASSWQTSSKAANPSFPMTDIPRHVLNKSSIQSSKRTLSEEQEGKRWYFKKHQRFAHASHEVCQICTAAKFPLTPRWWRYQRQYTLTSWTRWVRKQNAWAASAA